MSRPRTDDHVAVDVQHPVLDRFFTVNSLVVIGTREEEGCDLAPKHMAVPLAWSNHFGFVCTERHATYRSASREEAFSVSFSRPDATVVSGLTAALRCSGEAGLPDLRRLPTLPTEAIDAVVLENPYTRLERELDRIVDGFGENSLVAGRVVAARVHRDALRVCEGDDRDPIRRSPLPALLAPGRYSEIRDSDAFPSPAGLRH